MKKSVVVLVALSLSLPIHAEPRDGREAPTPVQRVVKVVKKLVRGVLSWDLTVPKP